MVPDGLIKKVAFMQQLDVCMFFFLTIFIFNILKNTSIRSLLVWYDSVMNNIVCCFSKPVGLYLGTKIQN